MPNKDKDIVMLPEEVEDPDAEIGEVIGSEEGQRLVDEPVEEKP